MTINTISNGYKAEGVQKLIDLFNKAAEKLFPECEVEHFYYGDKISMTDVRLYPGCYAHFSIGENRVSLTGWTCKRDDLMKFQSMTYKDDLYAGKLLQIAKA